MIARILFDAALFVAGLVMICLTLWWIIDRWIFVLPERENADGSEQWKIYRHELRKRQEEAGK